ncbi:hypothetical protein EVAR_50730_1 [Eumeta japonica]|uniref:Uncharacterized protein n=1 Tax=Eumeta variegata TaxID=151549 RepID=A0A4C1YRM2_EUMVA|nr:hypothetical protein EVAR_50730_1 [Eumeta japonica]
MVENALPAALLHSTSQRLVRVLQKEFCVYRRVSYKSCSNHARWNSSTKDSGYRRQMAAENNRLNDYAGIYSDAHERAPGGTKTGERVQREQTQNGGTGSRTDVLFAGRVN